MICNDSVEHHGGAACNRAGCPGIGPQLDNAGQRFVERPDMPLEVRRFLLYRGEQFRAEREDCLVDALLATIERQGQIGIDPGPQIDKPLIGGFDARDAFLQRRMIERSGLLQKSIDRNIHTLACGAGRRDAAGRPREINRQRRGAVTTLGAKRQQGVE